MKPDWLFPGHLVVAERSGSRIATRKARADAGVSISSTNKRKKDGKKEKPLQINLETSDSERNEQWKQLFCVSTVGHLILPPGRIFLWSHTHAAAPAKFG